MTADFMDRFGKEARKNQKSPNTRYAVDRDKWDQKVSKDIEREMKEYVLASKDLQQVADTGLEAMDDTLLALFKVQPHLKSSKEMRPSYLVNHKVMSELVELNDYESLHGSSAGDPISAGLAAVAMEPELERLFQRLEPENQQASDLEQMLQELEEGEVDAEAMAEALATGQVPENEKKDFQENLDALEEHLDDLRDKIEGGRTNLEESLDQKETLISDGVAAAMQEAIEQGEALSAADSWGFEKGGLRRLDPAARLALAEKLKSDKFRMMAEVFGRMQNIAFNSQLERSNYVPEEIYDLEQGNSLEHVLPTELAFIEDDVLALDFMRKYIENSLVQYALRGHEELNKGGIILLEDGSSSMMGTREVRSKAVGLALLKLAQMQHRSFHAIHFASANEYVEFNFDTSGPVVAMTRNAGGEDKEFTGIDAVLDFAETGLHGGTDFVTPLSRALTILQEQFNENGSTEGDIVFLTDGQCGVPPQFIDSFKAEQERLGFSIYGIAIETDPMSEPFNTICDGKVCEFGDLTDPEVLKVVFGNVGA